MLARGEMFCLEEEDQSLFLIIWTSTDLALRCPRAPASLRWKSRLH